MEQTEIIYLQIEENKEYENIINKTMQKCFEVEKLEEKLYVAITLTDNENIKNINSKYRNIDKETDVLSFPMFDNVEQDTIAVPVQQCLGDIIISIPKVMEQAEEYGHGFEREFRYMLVHGFYHLMGYDHMNEEDKKEMREKEEHILGDL